jgi:ribosomal-protein-alanine N-acetyltransferase
MSQEDAVAIAGWHYEEPYLFYDVGSDPEDLAELLDAAKCQGTYYSVRDPQRQLVRFFSFKGDGTMITIGLGLRPDLTGQGNG